MGVADLIRGAEQPKGIMSARSVLLLSGGWALSVFLAGIGALTWVISPFDWFYLAAMTVPALVFSLPMVLLLRWQASRSRVHKACAAMLEDGRARDDRLRIVGDLCDALRLRLHDDDYVLDRITQVEAQLWSLVEEEGRALCATDSGAPEGSESEPPAKVALTADIDRIIAGVSALHSATVSPTPAPTALDWLEAEVELAGPSRPRLPSRAGRG